MAGRWAGGSGSRGLGLCGLPVPAWGDRGSGALVPAVGPVLPGVGGLLAGRGLTVDHVTVCRWVQRFTPEFVEAAGPCRHAPGGRWFVDETCVKVAGQWTCLYRAVGRHGQVIDVLLSLRRDLAAARSFFTRALRAGTVPARVATGRAPVYPRVLDELVPLALHTVERPADNRSRRTMGG